MKKFKLVCSDGYIAYIGARDLENAKGMKYIYDEKDVEHRVVYVEATNEEFR